MSDVEWARQKEKVEEALFRSKGYLTEPPADRECMHITTGKGLTLYATLEADEEDADSDLYEFRSSSIKGDWLSLPIAEIKRQVEEEERAEERRNMQKKKNGSASNQKSVENTGGAKLWVDKYAPKSFADLLSDERVNRNVLIWLKEWSGVVFGEKFVNPLPRVRWQRTPGGPSVPITEAVEAKERPDHLCILISGPPGIGKTTLAHILAKQAGFEAVEFNASDDRTASAFMPKVLDVVSTESRFGSNKPRALIIDEIDGVLGNEGKGAIDALAKYLDEKKLRRPIICICNDAWAPALRPLRDRSLQFKLEPPSMLNLVSRLEMICLKEGVSIDSQLLQAICELTNRDIRSCLNTLQFLSRKSSHITAELFASTSFGNKDLSANIFDIWKHVFLKQEDEKRSSLMEILLANLPMRTEAKAPKQGYSSSHRDTSHYYSGKQIERISSIVKGAKVEKVVEGIHENALLVQYHDPMFQNTVGLANWFQFYDEMQSQVQKKQLFGLNAYLPYVGSAAHLLCSSATTHQYLYPRTMAASRAAAHVNEATVSHFLSGIVPPLRPYLDIGRIVTDFASYLIRILAPHLRPVNASLLNANERARLASLVTIHLAYGLNYIESSAHRADYPEDEERMAMWRKRAEFVRNLNVLQMPRLHITTHIFGLHPPIHRITHFSAIERKKVGGNNDAKDFFDSNKLPDFDATSDSVRQTIATQIHAEKLRRLSLKTNGVITEEFLREEAKRAVDAAKNAHAHKRETTTQAVANAGSKKASNEKAETEIFAKDFFGRKIVTEKSSEKDSGNSENNMTKKNVKMAVKKPTFFYKYHEGKTDAVRRKVLIKDLL